MRGARVGLAGIPVPDLRGEEIQPGPAADLTGACDGGRNDAHRDCGGPGRAHGAGLSYDGHPIGLPAAG